MLDGTEVECLEDEKAKTQEQPDALCSNVAIDIDSLDGVEEARDALIDNLQVI